MGPVWRIFLKILIIIGLVFVIFSSPVSADKIESLRGLPGVLVKVEAFSTMEQDGLKKAKIKSSAESKLHKSGIKVLSGDSWYSISGRPYILIKINGSKIQDNWKFYTYSVNVYLFQDVYLARTQKSDVFQASTWHYEHSDHGYLDDIRTKIGEIIDLFINDFKSVNS